MTRRSEPDPARSKPTDPNAPAAPAAPERSAKGPRLPGTDIALAALVKALADDTAAYPGVRRAFPELEPEKIRQGIGLAAMYLGRIGAERRNAPPTPPGVSPEGELPETPSVRAPGDENRNVGRGRLIVDSQRRVYVRLDLAPREPLDKSVLLTIHIDGCSKGNPGPAAVGVVFRTPEGRTVAEGCARLGTMTNNAAEYHALIAALAQADAWGVARLEVRTDSELLTRQMNGEYKVKSLALLPLVETARELRRRFEQCSIRHVPRDENRRADALANLAIDPRS